MHIWVLDVVFLCNVFTKSQHSRFKHWISHFFARFLQKFNKVVLSLDTILTFLIFPPELRNEKIIYMVTRSDLNLQYIFIIVAK